MSEPGASPSEQIIEAARRNNLELFEEVVGSVGDENKVAALINNSRDPLGNTALHVAAHNGSYEVLDYILDQEGVEVDPLDRLHQETPLHSVVKYAADEPEHGTYLAEMLIEAGADPRIKNKHGQKAIQLVAPGNTALKELLQSSEYAHMLGPVPSVPEEDQAGAPEDDGPSDDE